MSTKLTTKDASSIFDSAEFFKKVAQSLLPYCGSANEDVVISLTDAQDSILNNIKSIISVWQTTVFSVTPVNTTINITAKSLIDFLDVLLHQLSVMDVVNDQLFDVVRKQEKQRQITLDAQAEKIIELEKELAGYRQNKPIRAEYQAYLDKKYFAGVDHESRD